MSRGFTLAVREAHWEEQAWPDPRAYAHVWSPGATEPPRHRVFARWLTTHADDHAAYATAKRRLAQHGFEDSMDYNNAKGAFVYDLYERIFAADENHSHHPRPRPLA